jgi:hypothetical protein
MPQAQRPASIVGSLRRAVLSTASNAAAPCRAAACVAALLVLAAPSFAVDFYVDAVNGSNTTGTGDSTRPWKTITHALTQLPAQPEQLVHIAAGTYDAALGESYPLKLQGGARLIGAGIGETVLELGGLNGIQMMGGQLGPFDAARVSALSLRHGQRGLIPSSAPFHVADLSIESMSQYGIYDIVSQGSARLDRVRVSGCTYGVSIRADLGTHIAGLTGCVIEGCQYGLLVGAQVEQVGVAIAWAVLRETVVRDCTTGVGISGTSWGDTGNATSKLTTYDSLIHSCTTAISAVGDNDLFLYRSTLAGNVRGLQVKTSGNQWTGFDLYSSNVWANQLPDLIQGALYDAAWFSNSPTPYQSSLGNLSVDPHFVDATLDDYRLLPTSPLIDRGLTSTAQAGVDLDLDPRVLDGDLDLVARVDIGFDEWNPVHLAASGVVAPGATIVLDASAPSTWFAATFLSAGTADLAFGPGGNLLIDPANSALLASGVAPVQWSATLPTTPAILGLTVHAQAVGVAPVGTALGFSNRVDLTVE